ncbi:MAG: hypothetical protein AB8G96_16960 [Phycisphaerales bacterium]
MSCRSTRSLPVAAALTTAFAGSATALAGPPPVNTVSVGMFQLDEATVGVPWAVTVIVEVDSVDGVSGVTVDVPTGPDLVLLDADGSWSTTVIFTSFAEMLAFTPGDWTVSVAGSSPSTSAFSLSVSDLADGDFFNAPEFVSPLPGTNVPANSGLSWIDPTDGADPDAIAIELNSDNQQQLVDSFAGPITTDSTSWLPPIDFEIGVLNIAGLFYLNYGGPIAATPLVVTGGTIAWDDAPITPKGYPATTPRFTYGSANVTSFFASTPTTIPGDVSGDGVVNFSDLTLILAAWGPCAGCPADLTGDDVVDLTDLLTVLSNWDG